MPLRYEQSPASGALRQGEILAGIVEHIVIQPPIELPADEEIGADDLIHPLMIVMSADCDLEQDFNKRFPNDQAKSELVSPANIPAKSLISHVLLCDVFGPEAIGTMVDADILRRVRNNQEKRYHRFDSAPVGNGDNVQMPELFLDFKRAMGLPTKSLYEGLRAGGLIRRAIVPPIYVHDLMHGFYGFLSRVGLPDP